MAAVLPLVLVPGCCAARGFMPRKSRRFGRLGRLPWPITGATPTWLQSPRAFSPMRRRASRSPAYRWAVYIAFAMLRLAPERIAKLALLDTSARPDTAEQSAQREKFIAMADSGKLTEVVEILDAAFPASQSAERRGAQAHCARHGRRYRPEAFVRQQKAIMSRVDSRPLLAAIRCPTLVLVGDGDELTPPELSKEISAGISGARLMVVPDCGHLSTLEKPDAVNAALAEWLSA